MADEAVSRSSGRAAILVVNYASHGLLERNLGAIDLDAVDADVFVVDNFASEAARRAVRAVCAAHGWAIVEQPSNDGFGHGMNAGAARAIAAGCDVLVLLNPDVRIEPSDLRTLVSAVRADRTLAVSPRIRRPDGTTWFSGARVDRPHGRTRRTDRGDGGGEDGWLSGACLAVSAELWSRCRGFDERYFMYWEDVDLSFRIRAVGGALAVVAATAVHDPGGTQDTGGTAKSDLYYRYNCRNRLLFAADHLPRRTVRTWRRLTVAYAREVLLRGGRRQFLRRPVGPVAATVRGSIEGLLLSRGSRVADRG